LEVRVRRNLDVEKKEMGSMQVAERKKMSGGFEDRGGLAAMSTGERKARPKRGLPSLPPYESPRFRREGKGPVRWKGTNGISHATPLC